MPRPLLFLLTLLVVLASSGAGAQNALPYTRENPVVGDPLTAQLLAMFERAGLGRRATLSVVVSDAERGITYTDIESAAPRTPASLVKLITASAALDVLGPDFRFATEVILLGEGTGDVFRGDLVIRGGGDPSLGSRFQENPDDVLALPNRWATLVANRGITRIRGNVVGDTSRYTGDAHAMGWEPLEFGEWYSAEVSALNFNENVVDVIWRAGEKTGDEARYTLRPQTDYVTFASVVRSGPPSLRTPNVRFYRYKTSNLIRARGLLPPGATEYDFASVHDPGRYLAVLTREALQRARVDVTGVAVSTNSDDIDTTVPLVLDRVQSPPLSQLLGVVIGESQNLYAETLLREVAIARGAEPTFRGAAREAVQWLVDKDLHRTGTLLVDGSGLSSMNRLPARVPAAVLQEMNRPPYRQIFRRSLARPGTGSLTGRFVEGDRAALRGRLLAKTGFLENTHALAGYVEHRRGTEYLFVIMINDFDSDRILAARELLDDMVLTIGDHPTLP